MIYETELAHYGVLGMKWGKRKKQPRPTRLAKAGKKLNKKRKKNEKISNKNTLTSDQFIERTLQNRKIRNTGYAMYMTGATLKRMGKQQYEMYKYNSSPGRTAVISGLGYTGKALEIIGSMSVTTSAIRQYSDAHKRIIS